MSSSSAASALRRPTSTELLGAIRDGLGLLADPKTPEKVRAEAREVALRLAGMWLQQDGIDPAGQASGLSEPRVADVIDWLRDNLHPKAILCVAGSDIEAPARWAAIDSPLYCILDHTARALAATVEHWEKGIGFGTFGQPLPPPWAGETDLMAVSTDLLTTDNTASWLELLAPQGHILAVGNAPELQHDELEVALVINDDHAEDESGADERVATLYRRRVVAAPVAEPTPANASANVPAPVDPTATAPTDAATAAAAIPEIEAWRLQARAAAAKICPENAEQFEAAYQVARDIPGWLSPTEAARLYLLGRATEGDIVEIGTYFGKSTFLIASGMRDAQRPGRLITIDAHWRGIDPITSKQLILAQDSQLAVGNMLKVCDHASRVIQMIGWSDECAARVDFAGVAAVFIDGGHDFEPCRKDFLTVRPRLRRDRPTAILFHDYGADFPGVMQTVAQYVKTDPGFAFEGLHDTLFAATLRPPSPA